MEEVVLVKQYHSICLPVMDLDIVTRNTVAGTSAHLASNQGELRVKNITVIVGLLNLVLLLTKVGA